MKRLILTMTICLFALCLSANCSSKLNETRINIVDKTDTTPTSFILASSPRINADGYTTNVVISEEESAMTTFEDIKNIANLNSKKTNCPTLELKPLFENYTRANEGIFSNIIGGTKIPNDNFDLSNTQSGQVNDEYTSNAISWYDPVVSLEKIIIVTNLNSEAELFRGTSSYILGSSLKPLSENYTRLDEEDYLSNGPRGVTLKSPVVDGLNQKNTIAGTSLCCRNLVLKSIGSYGNSAIDYLNCENLFTFNTC